MMSAVRRVHVATMDYRVVAVNRAHMKPRRLREGGGEPQTPSGDQGTEPEGAAHDSTIHTVRIRFAN